MFGEATKRRTGDSQMEIMVATTADVWQMPIPVSLTTVEFAIASGEKGTWRCRTVLDLMLAGF